MKQAIGLVFSLLFMISGCFPNWGSSSHSTSITTFTSPTYTPFQPEDFTPLPTVTLAYPQVTPTFKPLLKSLWISPGVPDQLISQLLSSGPFVISDQETSEIRIEPQAPTLDNSGSNWIYALVSPFPTVLDDISYSDIQSAWKGMGQGIYSGIPILMDDSTLIAFSKIWGMPASGAVYVVEADQILEKAWNTRPSWGIIPFEEIEPRWKVLMVDGQSPLHNDFDTLSYPLKVAFSIQPPIVDLPAGNRDPEKLTTLIMTGVTALVRSTAVRMERKGLTYPAQDVRDTFRAADLTHISNEVPFAENCPSPYPIQENLIFCSDPRYIVLLEDIGTDIVELTGNHFQDYGSEATLLTLDMYGERNWLYFGGGRSRADAQKAGLIEHNGNKLAFIGCNPVGPAFSWATEDSPGSAECDFNFMYSEIARLRSEGYLPVATFQHYEYYTFYPTASQISDFRSMVDAGAVIVSGSQSHFPQYMEFYGDSYIHYGLGNLFFDQMDYPAVGTRREFVDRHVFYDGHYLGVELLTYMLEDYALPRRMTETERLDFLKEIFEAGGW